MEVEYFDEQPCLWLKSEFLFTCVTTILNIIEGMMRRTITPTPMQMYAPRRFCLCRICTIAGPFCLYGAGKGWNPDPDGGMYGGGGAASVWGVL